MLRINYIFHLEVEQLYLHPEITALMPDLRGSARLEAIEHDVMVMNVEAPPHLIQPLNENISLHEALGWLFVAESSTLATAFLQKFAKKLGLTRYSGASHICTDPDLYFLNWRNFTATIDTIVTNTVEEAKAIKGTQDALTRAFTLLNTLQTFPEQLLRKQPEYFLPEAR
ncbi:MAG: biliverdin-producing heme oxygenase [Pseudomonadota bacterium]